MEQTKNKIGYSENGGIFIGKNIHSDFHKHHLIAIVISFTEPFEIVQEDYQSKFCEVALIPPDISYKLSTSETDLTAFIHLDPYSEMGIPLIQNKSGIKLLNRSGFLMALEQIKDWYEGTDNTNQRTEYLLQSIVTTLTNTDFSPGKIDERVLRCIQYIRSSQAGIHLQEISELVCLSPGRLSHLFKKETGLTFKQFVFHCKLVKSLQAMHGQQNLTEASFIGGFSDQPHFTKTFKKTFGIKPSISKQ